MTTESREVVVAAGEVVGMCKAEAFNAVSIDEPVDARTIYQPLTRL